jgi:hypothetical protein
MPCPESPMRSRRRRQRSISERHFTLTNGEVLSYRVRPEDQRTEFIDAVRIRFDKTGEVVTIHIMALTERKRTIKEKKVIERQNPA